MVVRKKDSDGNYTDFRQCGDYRPLNAETNLDRYPLPSIEEIFNAMKGATIFSKLDLRSGYHQMPLRPEDRAKMALWGANRILWEWQVVPFGLKNAPPYFQRWMPSCGTCHSQGATLMTSSCGPTRSKNTSSTYSKSSSA